MAPTTYADVLTRNIRSARSRQGLDQANVVARMRALGHDKWHRQTMGKVERGERRITTDEMLALSLALETSIGSLMSPADDDKVIYLLSGEMLSVAAVQMSARGISESDVTWAGDVPVFSHGGSHPPSWMPEAGGAYIQSLQQARRRRAWELLPEDQQEAKLIESRELTGDRPEDTALTDKEREEHAPLLKIKPLEDEA